MKGAGLGLLEKVNSHNVISPEVKFLPAAPTTRTALCFEGKEGTGVLFSFLAAGLATPMVAEQGISSGRTGLVVSQSLKDDPAPW